MPEVVAVDHPLVATRLTELRDQATSNTRFRAALGELATLLVYEATRHLQVNTVSVSTPLGTTTGTELAAPPLLVPVLRAGLGLLDGALRLLSESRVGFVGLKRDETTLQPGAYVNAVPDDLAGRDVLVLDPMLATGGSAAYTLRLLRAAHAGRLTLVCVLCAPEGLAALDAAGFTDAVVVTAAIDEKLNEIGYIVPGLGDAGDRQFGVF